MDTPTTLIGTCKGCNTTHRKVGTQVTDPPAWQLPQEGRFKALRGILAKGCLYPCGCSALVILRPVVPTGDAAARKPCDERCMGSHSDKCDCKCMGVNHGMLWVKV